MIPEFIFFYSSLCKNLYWKPWVILTATMLHNMRLEREGSHQGPAFYCNEQCQKTYFVVNNAERLVSCLFWQRWNTFFFSQWNLVPSVIIFISLLTQWSILCTPTICHSHTSSLPKVNLEDCHLLHNLLIFMVILWT